MADDDAEAKKLAQSILGSFENRANIKDAKRTELVETGKKILSPISNFIKPFTDRFGFLGPTGIHYTDDLDRATGNFEGIVYYSHLHGPTTRLRFRITDTRRVAFDGFSPEITDGLVTTAHADRRHGGNPGTEFEYSVEPRQVANDLVAAVGAEISKFLKSIQDQGT